MMARSGWTGMTSMERSTLRRTESNILRGSCINAVKGTVIPEDVNVDRTFRGRHQLRDPAIEVENVLLMEKITPVIKFKKAFAVRVCLQRRKKQSGQQRRRHGYKNCSPRRRDVIDGIPCNYVIQSPGILSAPRSCQSFGSILSKSVQG